MFFFLAFLLVFPAWMRGGTRLELMGPAPWIALAALLAMLNRPTPRNGENLAIARMRVWRQFLSDPILFVGLAFAFLLWLQWWNGPRVEVFDVEKWAWTFAPPPRPGLPLFCVNRDESLEMLFWFIPVFVLLLVIRNGFSRAQKLDLLRVIAANAAVLALLGLTQYFTGATRVYGLTPQSVYFFATFGYQNHAGAFFVLAVILCVGLLLRTLLHKQEKSEDLSWIVSILVLCSVAALFSKSRAAILLISLIAVSGLVYGFIRTRRPYQATRNRLGILVSMAAFVGVIVYVAWMVPGNPVKEEMKGTTTEEMAARVDVETDPIKQTAWRIWRDHPWFGVGGWGFRHFVPHYLPVPEAGRYAPGAANVHMDPLQFLVEFGAVGAGLLLLTVILLLSPVIRVLVKIKKTRSNDPRHWLMRIPPLGMAILAGVVLVFCHSLVDLPFRSPAILWMWFALLACAPEFCDRHGGHVKHEDE